MKLESGRSPLAAAWVFLVAGFGLLMLALLVGPRAPYERQVELCVVNVNIAGPFGVSLNCDSPGFMRPALDPSLLLDPDNVRQSRPGLVLLAAAIAYPLSPLASLTQRVGVNASHQTRGQEHIDSGLAKNFPAYLAYVALNFVIVLLSFYVLQLIAGPLITDGASAAIFVCLGLLMAACDPVKAFGWSPHTQMFNIFVPVFVVWASVRATQGALAERRFAVLIGLICGFGATAYPFFLIILPCLFVAGLAAIWSGASWRASAINFVIVAVLTVLPELLWYIFVKLKTGDFYQFEMHHDRQVVWMMDALAQGVPNLIAEWSKKFIQLFRELGAQVLPAAGLLFILAGVPVERRTWRGPVNLTAVLLCCLMVSLAGAAFYTTAGNIVWRLAYPIVPPLIVGFGVLLLTVINGLSPRGRWLIASACIVVTIAQVVALLVTHGPYS